MSTPFILFRDGDMMDMVAKYSRKQLVQISGFFFVGLLCLSLAWFV